MDWNIFWNGGTSLNPFEIFLRVTVLYFLILSMTRLMGPRQVGIVSAFNFITHAGMAHVATARMVNPESSLLAAIVIILVAYSLGLVLSWIDFKFPSLVGTRPISLVKNGQPSWSNLKKAHITIDNLLAQLRLKKVHNLSEIAEALLEPMGELSIIKKPETLPVTRSQLNLPHIPKGMPLILIYEGKVKMEELNSMGLQENWLQDEIAKKGFLISDVMLATLESSGNIHVCVNADG